MVPFFPRREPYEDPPAAPPFFFLSLCVKRSDIRPLTFEILSSISGTYFSTNSYSSSKVDLAASLIDCSEAIGISIFKSVKT
jgi:hypothetical protein